MDIVNSKKKDLDTEGLVDNIEDMVVGGDLSQKYTMSLKQKDGKITKKLKVQV